MDPRKMSRRFLLCLFVLLIVLPSSCVHAQEIDATNGWFSFSQHGIDSSPTAISAADLLIDSPKEDPAIVIDKRGFVKVDENGHFVFANGGKRVRFWGVNLGAGAAFPPSPASPPRTGEKANAASAEQLAARLAKLGFNAVRLHHLDNMNWTGDGSATLWQNASQDTQQINPEQLDRIDYLIYQLKRHAIYVNLNLFVSRTFQPADGVTDALALQQAEAEFDKGATIFDPLMIELQKHYANSMLNHVNPYTGLAYKDDPVIFTTETNNENSLFLNLGSDQLNYRAGDAKSLPQFYSQELDGWSPLAGGPKINRIVNAGFESGSEGWYANAFEGANANFDVIDPFIDDLAEGKVWRVTVSQPGSEDWHIQFGQRQLAVVKGKRYRVSFKVSASQPVTINGYILRDSEPFDAVGWNESLVLDTTWQTFDATFEATETLFGNIRLSFDMGKVPTGTQLYFDQFSFAEEDAFPGWQGWLYQKYGSTQAIANAWQTPGGISESEIVSNGSFENALADWSMQAMDPAQASFTVDSGSASDGTKSLRVEVTSATAETWRVQAIQGGLSMKAGQLYQLSFAAKAQGGATIGAAVAQNHDPYESLGVYQIVNLGEDWQNFSFPFIANGSDSNGRVNFDLGKLERTIWIDNVSLKAVNPIGLADGESLEANNIVRLPRSQWDGYSMQRIRDLVQFYGDTETSFYGGMHSYLQSIGAQMLNTGTANLTDSLAAAHAQAATDYIDNHYYWEHPWWPDGNPWQPAGWVINNQAWVNSPFVDLFDKSLTAVKGKPFTVTEFREVTPNQYEAEGPLLFATFANLQDWDGIFIFAYAPDADDFNMEAPGMGGFFDLVGNPIQLGLMPVAARIFLQQQNAPAPTETVLRFTPAQMAESANAGWGGSIRQYLVETHGADSSAAFASRLRIADSLTTTPATLDLPTVSGPIYQSTSKQLIWDASNSGRNQYQVDAPHLQSVIGFVSDKAVALSNFSIHVNGVPAGAAQNSDFAAISLQSLDAHSIPTANRLLLSVATRFENTGYLWNEEHTSLNENWGVAPALIEPIRFAVTMTVQNPISATVRILDETGAPIGTLPHQVSDGKLSFVIDSARDKTLWYLIEMSRESAPAAIFLPVVARQEHAQK